MDRQQVLDMSMYTHIYIYIYIYGLQLHGIELKLSNGKNDSNTFSFDNLKVPITTKLQNPNPQTLNPKVKSPTHEMSSPSQHRPQRRSGARRRQSLAKTRLGPSSPMVPLQGYMSSAYIYISICIHTYVYVYIYVYMCVCTCFVSVPGLGFWV